MRRERLIAVFNNVSEGFDIERGPRDIRIYQDVIAPITYMERIYHDTHEFEAWYQTLEKVLRSTSMCVKQEMTDSAVDIRSYIFHDLRSSIYELVAEKLKGVIV